MNKRIRNIVRFSVIATLPVFLNVSTSNAQNNLESEFLSIVNKYNQENIIVENGISMKKNEILDLSQFPGWEMSNKNTIEIDENGIVHPINEGSVFLSNEIDEKVHIIEVYVSNKQTSMTNTQKSTTVDRDYYKVFVDPGHGGSDNGASGFGNLEDELNLKVATKVENKLKEKGIQVKMSRTSDTFISLSDRASMANSYGADVFVSIHQNAADAASANGIETFYHTDKSNHKQYSSGIQSNVIKETSARDRGVKSANFAVLRETVMPAVLFESGFITNEVESNNLANPAYQDNLATGIADGVEKYLKENIKLTQDPSTEPETPPTDPETPKAKTGEVTTSSLNVRSGYGTSYSKIGSLSKGSKVEIVESKNGWHKIKYETGYGYVSGEYIKILDGSTTQPPVEPETPKAKTGEVTTSSLNVRSGYGTSYSKIGSLSKGSKVEIVESKNGWHKIKYKTGYGYVSGEYVRYI